MVYPEPTVAAEPEDSRLPTVVLVGDSIRLSYAPIVTEQLDGKAIVLSPAANGGDSGNVLAHLDDWVIAHRPDVVHFNCGIHDTKRFKATGQYQVSPEQYEANLRQIVGQIRDRTDAIVLFATTTPILDERAAKARRGRDYELLGASVEQYNRIARKVMEELDVPVDDLHGVVAGAGADDLIGGDGVHLEPEGRKTLGKAVAEFISGRLPAENR
jgi:lysophospholipase L1-like esterase